MRRASASTDDELAAALLAARVRHHAVGAELVAAFDDGDVAAVGVLAGGELGLEGLVGLAVVEAGDAGLAGFKPGEHLGQFAVGGRTRDQRDVRRALEDLLALLLRHAAQHGEALAFPVLALVFVEPVEDLLLRLVADGAGVVEDQAGIFFRLHLPVALLPECANHLLRVMGIHLAAEGLKIEGFFGCHSNLEYTAIRAESIASHLSRQGNRTNTQLIAETGFDGIQRRFLPLTDRQDDLNPAARKIGMRGRVTSPPLPHHRTSGSASGGSKS